MKAAASIPRRRGARELRAGFYVNLGIGIPPLVANHIPEAMSIQLHSENGMLGMGSFPFEVGEGGLRLVDIAPEVTVEELRSKTEASFVVAPELKVAA
jgi:acyl CoA:acetate/3-ketoacid CoA transferase beta subunit